MSEDRLLYLTEANVRAAGLPMRGLIEALADAFRDLGEGHAEVPAKIGVHPSAGSFFHAMPALWPGASAAAVKWVGSFPGNRGRGQPSISALLVLSDPDDGRPLAVMDGRWLTVRRTAACSALSARFLARSEARTLGVMGCGLQARAHVEAFRGVLPITRVKAFDRHPERARTFAEEVACAHGVEASAHAAVRDVVEGADVVLTAGAIGILGDPPIAAGWLAPGAFACSIDYASPWSGGALAEVNLVSTDDRAQLEAARKSGPVARLPPIHADLAELVTGRSPGRTDDLQRTMACNLGLALADLVAAALVYRRALEVGLGTLLPL
ncbi:MAG TPA: ornithine cyclodeaminase family protein [Myxococcaceae bacterium]|nr:ornithine cyclodeaminase family protein [Myxococcaceae bacterium]